MCALVGSCLLIVSLFTVGIPSLVIISPQVAGIHVELIHVVLSETEKLPDSGEKRQAIDHLNSQLMDVTTLYGDFADELDLHECKLAILHCARRYDAGLIESLWRSIFSKGVCSNLCSLHRLGYRVCQCVCACVRACVRVVYGCMGFCVKYIV